MLRLVPKLVVVHYELGLGLGIGGWRVVAYEVLRGVALI